MSENITDSLEKVTILSSKQKLLTQVLERLLKLFPKEQNNSESKTPWEKYLFSLDKTDRSIINVAEFKQKISADPEFIAKNILEWIFKNQVVYAQENQNPAVFLKDTQFENPRVNTDSIYVAIKNSEDTYTVLKGENSDDDKVKFKKFNNITLRQLQELGKVSIMINSSQKDIQPGNCWDHSQVLPSVWLNVDIDTQKIVFNSDHLVLDGHGIISMLASLSQAVIDQNNEADSEITIPNNHIDSVEKPEKFEPLLSFDIEGSEKIDLSNLRTAFLQTLKEDGIKGTILIPVLTDPEKPRSRIAIVLGDIKMAQDFIQTEAEIKRRISMLLNKDKDSQVLSKIFALLYNPKAPQKLQESLKFLVENHPKLTLQLYNLLAGNALFSTPIVSVESVGDYKIYANTMKNRQVDSINLVMVTLKEKNTARQKYSLCLSGAGRFTNIEELKSFKERLSQKYRELQQTSSKN